MDDITVTRQIDLDMPADELWARLTDGDMWRDWIGTWADVDIEPGGTGTVVDDDGLARELLVERVDRERGIRFSWWPASDHDLASTVDLVVIGRPNGITVLRVTEVLPRPWTTESRARHIGAVVGGSWERRFSLLGLHARLVLA